jgi:hypothetical protein
MHIGTTAEELAKVSAVFQGEIVAVHQEESTALAVARLAYCAGARLLGLQRIEECFMPHDGLVAEFRVKAAWKGVPGPTVRVLSWPAGGGSCGVHWQVGDEWVVYAHGIDRLATSICSRSSSGAEAKAEALALGAPREAFE